MEGLKLCEISFENHIKKCRICFKSFADDEYWNEVNKTVERKFFQMTQTNLIISSQLSSRICVVCSFQLTTFCHAKLNVIKAQKALAKFINSSRKSPKSGPKNSQKCTKFKAEHPVEEEVYEEEVIEEHLMDDGSFHEISYQIVETEHVPVGNELLKCGYCQYEMRNQSDFEDHVKEHEIGGVNSSFSQATESASSQQLSTAFSSNFNENAPKIDETLSKPLKSTKFNCHDCNKSFSGTSSLANHIAIYHSTSSIELPCPVVGCGKICKTKKQLVQHMKTHNEDKQICPHCGLVVGNKHNLTKHIKRLHLRIYNFYCDLCDYKGFFKFNIDQHMKKHVDKSEREKFYCDECHFESISKMSLKTHKRMEHLGQKRTYICHCGKTFTQSSSYYTHVKVVHQKIKNHACPYADCSKAFAERSQLKNHVKSQHLKKKDIPCTICGKFFATQKHLAAHLKYHQEPSFVCQFENCKNTFYTATQLTSHYKVHNNQRDFACQLCDKKYFHRSHLKKHMLTHGGTSFNS